MALLGGLAFVALAIFGGMWWMGSHPATASIDEGSTGDGLTKYILSPDSSTLYVDAKNNLNRSDWYPAASFAVLSYDKANNPLVRLGSQSASSTQNQTEISVQPNAHGIIYALGTATLNGGRETFDASSSNMVSKTVSVTPVGYPVITWRDKTKANLSLSDYNTTSAAQTLGASECQQYYLDLEMNASDTAFGTEGVGVYIAIKSPNLAAINPTYDLAITGTNNYPLSVAACPEDFGTLGAQVCYKGAVLTRNVDATGIGVRVCTQDNPGASDDLVFSILAPSWNKKLDGSYAAISFVGSTNVGPVKETATLNVS